MEDADRNPAGRACSVEELARGLLVLLWVALATFVDINTLEDKRVEATWRTVVLIGFPTSTLVKTDNESGELAGMPLGTLGAVVDTPEDRDDSEGESLEAILRIVVL